MGAATVGVGVGVEPPRQVNVLPTVPGEVQPKLLQLCTHQLYVLLSAPINEYVGLPCVEQKSPPPLQVPSQPPVVVLFTRSS